MENKQLISQWFPKQICSQVKLISIAMVVHERIYQLIRKDKMNRGNTADRNSSIESKIGTIRSLHDVAPQFFVVYSEACEE
jgi:IS30 family transposase